MNQFIEKIQNANSFQKNSLKAEPKISKHHSRKIDQLIGEVTQLINALSEGSFKSLEVGREALDDYRSIITMLESARDDGGDIDAKVKQTKKNFKGLELVQKVNIVGNIGKLKDKLEQAKGYGYDKDIYEVLLKLKKLDNNAAKMNFKKFCDRYARYHQFAEKILLDVSEAKEQEPFKNKLADLRGKISALIKYISQINFTISESPENPVDGSKIWSNILDTLQGQLNSLPDKESDFNEFDGDSLVRAQDDFQAFIESQSLKLNEEIQKWNESLELLSARLFCLDEIKNLQGEIENSQNGVRLTPVSRFKALCEAYGNFHRIFNNINTDISKEAEAEYQALKENRVRLNLKDLSDLNDLSGKIEEVERSNYLSESEKQNFKDNIQKLKLDHDELGAHNIKKGAAALIMSCCNPFENHAKLIGDKDSIANKRKRFYENSQKEIKNKVPFLSIDNRKQWVKCIRQSLLTNSKDQIEGILNEDAATDPHAFLFKTLKEINFQMSNLEATFEAYENFVNDNHFNFRHTKNGIRHAKDVVDTAINKMSSFLNKEVGELLERASSQGGDINEQDLMAFNERLVDVKERWEKETLLDSSEKSGFNRHSFNNYLRYWIIESKKEEKKKICWYPTNINDAINDRCKNSFEIFAGNPLGFFFGDPKKAYNMNGLRLYIEIEKKELREMDDYEIGLGMNSLTSI